MKILQEEQIMQKNIFISIMTFLLTADEIKQFNKETAYMCKACRPMR